MYGEENSNMSFLEVATTEKKETVSDDLDAGFNVHHHLHDGVVFAS